MFGVIDFWLKNVVFSESSFSCQYVYKNSLCTKYCVLTEIYTASVIINAVVFRSLVLMKRRRLNDDTECVVVSLTSTRKHVIC